MASFNEHSVCGTYCVEGVPWVRTIIFQKMRVSYQVAALVQAGMGPYSKPVLHRQMQLILWL